jgi:hypothetical protein
MSVTKRPPSRRKQAWGGIGFVIIGGLVLMGLLAALIWLIQIGFILGDRPGVTTVINQEESISAETRLAHQATAEAKLNNYGWIDQGAEKVRIPIEQAINLLIVQGLPVGNEEPVAIVQAEPPTPTLEPTATIEPSATPEPTSTLNPTVTLTTSIEIDNTTAATATLEPTAIPEPTETPEPTPAAEPPTPTPEPEPAVDLTNVSFQNNILPIFEARCTKCHGDEQPEGGTRVEEGLNLLTYDDLMAGSWNGSVIEPGDIDNSYLIEQIVTGRMPKREDPLTEMEIEIITAWVEAGALDN